MLGLGELKKTTFYQEAFEEGKQEGKLETVPQLLSIGLSIEQIAQALNLDIETVKQAGKSQSL
jgi:predicted transposase/invertase (TIGR01784 family)